MANQDPTTDALLGQAVRLCHERGEGLRVFPTVVGRQKPGGRVTRYYGPAPDALRALIRDLGDEPQAPAPEPEAIRLLREAREWLDGAAEDTQSLILLENLGGRIDAYLARQEPRPDPWGGVTPEEVSGVLRRVVSAGVSSYGPKGFHDAAALLTRIPEPEEGGDD